MEEDPEVLVVGHTVNGRFSHWTVPGMESKKQDAPHPAPPKSEEQQAFELVYAIAGMLASIDASLQSIDAKLGPHK